MTSLATVSHPARYSAALLEAFRPLLADAPHVHDPFAGTGERLGALCDELGVTFSGTELEAPFIVDPRVRPGDSRHSVTYPECYGYTLRGHALGRRRTARYWIVTSPVYANGMADNFRPSGVCSHCGGDGMPQTVSDLAAGGACPKCDGTGRRPVKRYTYRAALIETTGDPYAELTEGNMGAHSYRGGQRQRERYWAIARDVIACWRHAERVVVNVSDFPMGGAMVPHVGEWCRELAAAGFSVDRVIEVETPRMRNGANRGLRAPAEAIIVGAPL